MNNTVLCRLITENFINMNITYAKNILLNRNIQKSFFHIILTECCEFQSCSQKQNVYVCIHQRIDAKSMTHICTYSIDIFFANIQRWKSEANAILFCWRLLLSASVSLLFDFVNKTRLIERKYTSRYIKNKDLQWDLIEQYTNIL